MGFLDSTDKDDELSVDDLIAKTNEAAPERPMGGEQTPVQVDPKAAAPIQEFEYEFSGRKIKEPIDMILKRASMGYDYAQKMEAFKREQTKFKTDLEQKYKPYDKYKTIDEYVQKDPKWWQHVEESYQNRLASEDPTIQRVKSLLDEELKPVRDLLSQKDQEAQQAKITDEDNRLSQDIKSIRDKYANLDFDTPDAEGKSLELKILEHGAKNNYPTFTSAFRDFYHDQLEKMWESKGRESIGKEADKRQKLGLSGVTRTPTPKSDGSYDVRGKNLNQILHEVLEREGIT